MQRATQSKLRLKGGDAPRGVDGATGPEQLILVLQAGPPKWVGAGKCFRGILRLLNLCREPLLGYGLPTRHTRRLYSGDAKVLKSVCF